MRNGTRIGPLFRTAAEQALGNGISCKCLIVLTSQSIPTWNQIVAWLKEIEMVRKTRRLSFYA